MICRICHITEIENEGRTVCDDCLHGNGPVKETPSAKSAVSPEDEVLHCVLCGPYKPWKLGRQICRKCPKCTLAKRRQSNLRAYSEGRRKNIVTVESVRNGKIDPNAPNRPLEPSGVAEGDVDAISGERVANVPLEMDLTAVCGSPDWMFAHRPEVLAELRRRAENEERTLEQQIVWICRAWVREWPEG